MARKSPYDRPHTRSEQAQLGDYLQEQDRKASASTSKMKSLTTPQRKTAAKNLAKGRGGVRKKDSFVVTAETRAKPHRELARERTQGQEGVKTVKAGFRRQYGRGKYLVKTYNQTKEKYVKG